MIENLLFFFFFSSRRRHTRSDRDWSSDVCSSDLKNCKKEQSTPQEAMIEIGFSAEEASKIKTYKGQGCATCNNTGYKGRVGLYEVMEVTDEVRELILIGASALELRKKAIEDGMITLRESGLHKIRAGITTVEEVVRETVA